MDRDQMMQALRNAHSAGDTQAAQRIAGMINALPSQAPETKRTLGQTIYENVVGSGEIDTPGERLGAAIGDVISSGAAGVSRGLTGLADLPGAVVEGGGQLAMSGLERGARALGIDAPETFEAGRQAFQALPFPGGDTPTVTEAVSDLTGGASQFRGETLPGQYAGTVGEFLPGAAIPGGSAANLLRYGVLPGVASEAAGQLTEGTALEPYARTAAAIAAPTAATVGQRAAMRAITPFPADPARIRAAESLQARGVPVTAGQAVGSEPLRRMEGFTSQGQGIASQQQQAITAQAMRSIGSTAPRATEGALSEAASRIGSVMDDALSGIDITPTGGAVTGLAKANQTFKELSASRSNAPMVGGVLREVTSSLRSGSAIPGTTVNAWRSRLSKLTTDQSTPIREAAKEALSVIDDMLDDAANIAGTPEAVSDLRLAREQYRNLLAIQGAASRAGEGAAIGILSPSALRSELAKQGRSSFVQGRRGDIADMAKEAEAVIKPLPTSGTAENMRALMAGRGLQGGGIGGGLGAAAGVDPLTSALIGAGTAVMPSVVRQVAVMPSIQQYLRNQLITGAGPTLNRTRLALPLAGAMTGGQ